MYAVSMPQTELVLNQVITKACRKQMPQQGASSFKVVQPNLQKKTRRIAPAGF
jgi:hypothetical protein